MEDTATSTPTTPSPTPPTTPSRTVAEACTMLDLRPADIHREVKAGHLKADSSSGTVLIDSQSITDFAEARRSSDAALRDELQSWFGLLNVPADAPDAPGVPEPETPPAPPTVDQLVTRLAQGVLAYGAAADVRDLYLDPVKDGVRLLARTAAGLGEKGRFSAEVGGRVRAELKKLLGCPDAAQTPVHAPYSGQIGETALDLGGTLAPTLLGDHLHIVYRAPAVGTPLVDLGYTEEQAERVDSFLDGPPGLLLACGSADVSADRHRLALAAQLAEGGKVVVSLEHEQHMKSELLVQLVIPAGEETDFGAIIRSVLRMSPDALFLDDVRNAAEASACLEAAAAGIMVVAQMRAVDNAHALKRFTEFGVPPPQLTEYLVALVNRRSIRTLCPRCRAKGAPDERAASRLGLDAGADVWHAAGCDACRAGFVGKRSVYDVWPAGPRLTELLCAEEMRAGDLLAWGRSQPLGLLPALKSAVVSGSIDPADAAAPA